MSAASIPAARGGDYARYLEGKTVAPERGDYYLTPDGELTEAPGRWLADPETLEALGIQPGVSANGEDFVALMEGQHPETGAWLRRAGPDGARGGGIDGVFSAPKSVSTVWALADPWQREQIEQAHANAVEQTVAYMREHVPLVRRRYGAEVIEEPAKDLIAVEYRHTTARGVSGADAPDPQLHSHVVITSAVRADDRIVAVASRPVFRAAGELGAFYRSTLAQELATQGYRIERGTGKDGKYFEIAGVPETLRDAFSGRSREVARAADRFRARYGRAPERGELRDLALENRRAKTLTNRTDLDHAWQETASRHDFGPDQALQLLAAEHPPVLAQRVVDCIEQHLTEHRAVFELRDLHTIALEQTVGELDPHEALQLAHEMIRERRVLTLEGGRLTTLAVRAQEQAIERRTRLLAQPAGRDVGHIARANAGREVAERIGSPLTDEQDMALLVLTGPERATALIGPAGTGKGVVIDATARAEQLAGHTTIGIAVSGSTAERLGTDSPALQGSTLTLNALVARANTGRVHIDTDTTIILDEAGMADHKRLDALTELIERTGAKLIAVGDGKQLPSIGPGGMFDRLTQHTPTVELETIHRTKDAAEQRAWQALRAGEPERAMAHYKAQGRLHLADTRDQAAENAVQAWAQLTSEVGIDKVALIADSSNQEIDRLNARAQHIRAQRGELGANELPLSSVNYGLRQGDRVAFIVQHRPPGLPRVENGTRGQVAKIDQEGTFALRLDGSDRQLQLAPSDAESLRLAYAQHVYRQQGATVDRAIVLTGGWQTSRETAYVQATRARKGTDWHLARDQLDEEGQDPDRITRLARRMAPSRLQTPSITYRESADLSWNPNRDPLRLGRFIPRIDRLLRTPLPPAPDRMSDVDVDRASRAPLRLIGASAQCQEKNAWRPSLTGCMVVRMDLGFRFESEMTQLVAAACPWWWLGSRQHDFVATEIVGPDAIADLVGIRFDQRRLKVREAEGINPVTDALALRALQACRGRVLTTRELADACHVTPSGIRRAQAVAIEANAMIRQARGRYSCHPAWGPVGARLVAVELKLDNWRAAFQQAQAYSRWANATWVVIGRTPPVEAKREAERDGFGLAVLGTDGKIKRLSRPRAVRRPRSAWAALWASEQAIARAISAGYRSESAHGTAPTAAQAIPADAGVASLQSA